MKRTMLLVFLVVAIGACSRPQPVAEPGPLVWVATPYTGGAQCEEDSGYRPPNTVRVLRRQGVQVHATVREPLLVCLACGCPSYSHMHYALIADRDLERAARAGYRLRTLPEYVLPDTLRPRLP